MSDLHAPQATLRPARAHARARRRRSIRGLAAAAVLLAAAPLAAACGAGFTSATQYVKPNGGSGASGPLLINNIWVVVDQRTNYAQVIGAVANTGTSLARVTGARASGVPALVTGDVASGTPACNRTVVAAGSVVVPPNRSVGFGRPGCPQLSLLGGIRFRPGRVASVTLTFAQSAPLTVNAQIVSDTGLFTEYRPLVRIPTATPSPTRSVIIGGTASPTGTATATATTTTTASPSPNPSVTPGGTLAPPSPFVYVSPSPVA
ncbi:MAG TPA: hypothetical protein VFU73_09490 [Actinocrinis sp.]|nr:hypothetical protein [Actinocrinis sp.]